MTMIGLNKYLFHRCNGELVNAWRRAARQERLKTLGLSRTRLFNMSQTGSINSLALDNTEQRYLLSGATDASVAIFDTQSLGRTSNGLPLDPVCLAGRNTPGGNKYMVSSVAWYPFDSGMFITGSYDQDVKCWDANTMEVVCTFGLPSKVAAIAMSPITTSHCLIAAGCHDPLLRLCDPSTGAFTHTLVGHKDPIWSVAWSYRSEYELVSGDTRGQVRVWDIRRFGSLQVLDHYATTPARVLRQQQQQQQQQQRRSSQAAAPWFLPLPSVPLLPPHSLTPAYDAFVSLPPKPTHQLAGSTLRPTSRGTSAPALLPGSGLPHLGLHERSPSAAALGGAQPKRASLSTEEAVDAAWACFDVQRRGSMVKRGGSSKRTSMDCTPSGPSKRAGIGRTPLGPSKRASLDYSSVCARPAVGSASTRRSMDGGGKQCGHNVSVCGPIDSHSMSGGGQPVVEGLRQGLEGNGWPKSMCRQGSIGVKQHAAEGDSCWGGEGGGGWGGESEGGKDAASSTSRAEFGGVAGQQRGIGRRLGLSRARGHQGRGCQGGHQAAQGRLCEGSELSSRGAGCEVGGVGVQGMGCEGGEQMIGGWEAGWGCVGGEHTTQGSGFQVCHDEAHNPTAGTRAAGPWSSCKNKGSGNVREVCNLGYRAQAMGGRKPASYALGQTSGDRNGWSEVPGSGRGWREGTGHVSGEVGGASDGESEEGMLCHDGGALEEREEGMYDQGSVAENVGGDQVDCQYLQQQQQQQAGRRQRQHQQRQGQQQTQRQQHQQRRDLQHQDTQQQRAQHQQWRQQQEAAQQQEREVQEQRQQQRYWALLGSSNSQSVGTLAPVPLQATQRGTASRGLIGGHAPTARSLMLWDGVEVGGRGGVQEEVVRSHQGAVTSITPTPDGLHWLTAGTDDRLRLWDALDWHHWLVAYPYGGRERNKATRGKQCAVTADSAAVFYPSGSVIQVFDVSSGSLLNQLKDGHLSSVNALVWNPDLEELYSGGNDGQIITWAPGLRF